MKHSKPFRRKILIIFIIGYSCIIGALFSYSLYLNDSYQQSIRQTGTAMLNLYVSELDDLLQRNNTYLLQTATQNVHAILLQSPNTSTVRKYSAIYDLNQEQSNQLTMEKGIAGFLTLYNSTESFCFYKFQKNISFDDIQTIRQFVSDGIGKEGFFRIWLTVQCNNKSYLALTYQVKDTCFSVAVDFEAVTSNIVNRYASGKTVIIFNDKNGILQNKGTTDGIDAVMTEDNSRLAVRTKGYISLAKTIENTDLTMNILIPDGSTKMMQWSQVYILGILLLACGCALISYYYIYRKLIRPTNQMTQTMKRIMEGQIDAKMPEHIGIDEYEQTGRVFNSMMSQIRDLKIKTYEDKIKEQKSRLQYLQLMIKPHFYLNSLKALYALLQMRKYKALGNAIIDTSQFLRYIFLDIFCLVKVREELNFTRNYVNMQKGSTRIDIDCDIAADANVIEEEILPLTIQTFVENSVKYAEVEGTLALKIRINRLSDETVDYLDIVVSDNGQGYADEWLAKINRDDDDEPEGDHIGILNLKKRIELQYGEKAEFVVRNDHGAISEVLLPIKKQV